VTARRSHLTSRDSFRVSRGVRWTLAAACPLLAALAAWLAWTVFQERLGGRPAENPWLFALLAAALAGVVLFLAAGTALAWRARLELGEEGFLLRGLFRTRRIPWTKVEGYRWLNGQMNAYLAEDEWPLNLAHFERRAPLYAWFQARVPDLHATELAREAREIDADLELGFTDEERRARLGELRRLVRAVSWPAYAAAGVAAANALFFEWAGVQLAAACVLIAVPPVLVLLALQYRRQIRIGPAEGSAYPDALQGILISGAALSLVAVLDPHTLLGEGFWGWMLPATVLLAGLWLVADRERLREHARSYSGAVLVAAALVFSGFWAGGGVYLFNTGADLSEPDWDVTRVTELDASTTKAGKLYHVTVAPWRASSGPVELDVPRATWEVLRVGAPVRVGVRGGALGIPWVSAVLPAGTSH